MAFRTEESREGVLVLKTTLLCFWAGKPASTQPAMPRRRKQATPTPGLSAACKALPWRVSECKVVAFVCHLKSEQMLGFRCFDCLALYLHCF